jgi:hypothetical protein
MRNRALHDALSDFALEAAKLLSGELERGAELAFEVAEEPGSGTVLYRYRPLTSEFIAERWPRLRELASCSPAGAALGSGAAAFLRVQGVPGVDAEPALRAMLERLYEDATAFDFPEQQFERVYADVERTLYDDTLRARVVAPLRGLGLEGERRVELGEGLALVSGGGDECPPEAARVPADQRREPGDPPPALCLLECELASGAPLPMADARARFRRLVTGLRLLKPGAVAFGPLAWARAESGSWQPFELGSAGNLRGERYVLSPVEEADLRELLGVLGRSPEGGRVAWALGRFELGCERALDTEALSDYLLALQALLGAGDERSGLSLKLAALCAEEAERRAVRRRLELAFSLERFLIDGGGEEYVKRVGPESPGALVLELEGHVRALLRDVLCGYLEPDLRAAADDILLRSGEPFEVEARDLRRDPERPRAPRAPAPPPRPRTPRPPTPRPATPRPPAAEADTDELPALGGGRFRLDADPEPEPCREALEPGPEAGVTPSADWGFEDDEDSYSAPV